MALLQGVCRVVVDYPDADGMIEQNEHGFGKTWAFDDYKPGAIVPEFASQVRKTPVWDYTSADCEIIAPLKAAAPRGTAVPYDMTLDNWTVDNGKWRDTVIDGQADKDYLWYYDGQPDQSGRVTSVDDFWPNISFFIRRYPVPYNQTEASFILIIWYGIDDGESAFQGHGGYHIAFLLPLSDSTYKYPLLLRKPTTVDTWVVPDHVIDEYQQAVTYTSGYMEGSRAEVFSVENVVGNLLVNYSELTETWLFRPEVNMNMGQEGGGNGIRLDRGKIGIKVQGHPVCIRVLPIEYPTNTTLLPYNQIAMPHWVRDQHFYQGIKHTVTGTDVTLTGRGTSSGSLFGGEAAVYDENSDNPVITFTSNSKHKRAIIYVVNEIHLPAFTEARQTADFLFDGQEDKPPIMSARGRVDDSWRGASCELAMRFLYDSTGPYHIDSADLQIYIDWKGNEKVTVKVDWDDGSRSPGDVFTTDTQFTGYIQNLDYKRDDELGYITVTAQCEDGIAARMMGKKKMVYHSAYAGMRADVVFQTIMNRCNIKDSKIDLSDIQYPDGTYPYMPEGFWKGDLLFDFRADEEALSALDKLAASRAWFFGVNNEGSYFVKERPVYEGLDPDFTLDDDTTTEADLLYAVSATRGHDEFRNYVAGIVGQGAHGVSAIRRDESHWNTSSSGFIGDDWWEVLIETDADPEQADLLVEKRLNELVQRELIIAWETRGKPDLWPDDFVKVQVDGLEVPTDTIFRIISKEWSIAEDGDYRSNFLGAVVSYGA